MRILTYFIKSRVLANSRSTKSKTRLRIKQTTIEPTLPVERISVVVVTGSEFDEDIGLSGLQFVELEPCHFTPDTERPVQRETCFIVAQIGREVENPDREKCNETLLYT